jgi:oligoendopeptidase F
MMETSARIRFGAKLTATRMKKFLWLLPAGLLVLSGCARGYVMTLDNGTRLRTASKPHLVNGFYYYKDAMGNTAEPVFSSRVTEIVPASMAPKEQTLTFKPVSSH